MLLFLNLDGVLADPADAPPPHGMAGLAAVLDAWPGLRIVVSSEHRYRMTIEQLRGLFFAPHRHQVVGTTLIYGGLACGAQLSREAEILDWLRHARAWHADWLALDQRLHDFDACADRLVPCPAFTPPVAAELQARLRRWPDAAARRRRTPWPAERAL